MAYAVIFPSENAVTCMASSCQRPTSASQAPVRAEPLSCPENRDQFMVLP